MSVLLFGMLWFDLNSQEATPVKQYGIQNMMPTEDYLNKRDDYGACSSERGTSCSFQF